MFQNKTIIKHNINAELISYIENRTGSTFEEEFNSFHIDDYGYSYPTLSNVDVLSLVTEYFDLIGFHISVKAFVNAEDILYCASYDKDDNGTPVNIHMLVEHTRKEATEKGLRYMLDNIKTL